MAREQHRHDISDKAWEKIRLYTIGERGTRGGNARDTRQFINGVFGILRTGAPWRDLPEAYGDWKMYTVVSAVGVTRESGKRFWNPWWTTQILSGW